MNNMPLHMRKQYFSRKGETLESWLEVAEQGRVLIFPHLDEAQDTVYQLAESLLRSSGRFDEVEWRPFDVPLDLTTDSASVLVTQIKRAFAPPTDSDVRTLRVPVFRAPIDPEGHLADSASTFFHIIRDMTKNGRTLQFSDHRDGNTVIFPILDVTTSDLTKTYLRKVLPKIRSNIKGDGRDPLVFDVRSFDAIHLQELLQPAFPEEDLSLNSDFRELLETHGGEARLAFAVRSYKRKGTLGLFRGSDGEPLVDEAFSSVYRFVKSQLLDEAVTIRVHRDTTDR